MGKELQSEAKSILMMVTGIRVFNALNSCCWCCVDVRKELMGVVVHTKIPRVSGDTLKLYMVSVFDFYEPVPASQFFREK